jgi:hypothetical protein
MATERETESDMDSPVGVSELSESDGETAAAVESPRVDSVSGANPTIGGDPPKTDEMSSHVEAVKSDEIDTTEEAETGSD